MRGRLPLHAGTGPGLSPRRLGAKAGSDSVALTTNQLARHGHAASGRDDTNTNVVPQDRTVGHPVKNIYRTAPNLAATMASQSLSAVGGSRSHTNLMPFLCVNFIVALFGIYPSRQ
jgi:microcystin-dependent protein